jgi:hypothetical protein
MAMAAEEGGGRRREEHRRKREIEEQDSGGKGVGFIWSMTCWSHLSYENRG